MGGLSCAALLARRGMKVLVVERHDRPGGYTHSFQRGKRHFDAAIHMSGGCAPGALGGGGLLDDLLNRLNVRDECNFIPLDKLYTAIYPGMRFEAPVGIPEFIYAHADVFPSEEKGFREFVRLCVKLNKERTELDEDADVLEVDPERFPLLAQYHQATLESVLTDYVSDPHARALFVSLWPFQGLPPSRLAAIQFSPMLASFLSTGAHYCEGTFQRVSQAFIKAFEADGGELLLRTGVRRITVKDGAVTGVVLEHGQRIAAPIVVSNADANQTFEELVGTEHLPSEFVSHLRSLRPSVSAVNAYLGTNLDLANHPTADHHLFFFESWDHDEIYRGMVEGRPSGVAVSIPTLLDPSLAPEGEHLLAVIMLLPYEVAASWRTDKAEYQDALLRQLEVIIPGLTENITFAEGASPRTMERYTLNKLGALYGWEPTPDNTGVGRLGHRTPIDGLMLSGHWTKPGEGLYPSRCPACRPPSWCSATHRCASCSSRSGPEPLSYFWRFVLRIRHASVSGTTTNSTRTVHRAVRLFSNVLLYWMTSPCDTGSSLAPNSASRSPTLPLASNAQRTTEKFAR